MRSADSPQIFVGVTTNPWYDTDALWMYSLNSNLLSREPSPLMTARFLKVWRCVDRGHFRFEKRAKAAKEARSVRISKAVWGRLAICQVKEYKQMKRVAVLTQMFPKQCSGRLHRASTRADRWRKAKAIA